MAQMDEMVGMKMNHSGMAMQMYFYTSSHATILFKGWNVNSVGAMIGSCIAVFVMAALYEGFKVFRETLKKRHSRKTTDLERGYGATSPTSHGHVDDSFNVRTRPLLVPRRSFIRQHILQSLLHVVQVTFSYFLMLIFMTYNAWLCIAVALGAGFGYLVFGWKLDKAVDMFEHCH